MRSPDGDAYTMKFILREGVGEFLEAEDVRCGNRARTTFADSRGKMLERSDAAAGNDGNRNPGGDTAQQFNVVTVAHAVAVDRNDEDFSRPARRRFGRPIA